MTFFVTLCAAECHFDIARIECIGTDASEGGLARILKPLKQRWLRSRGTFENVSMVLVLALHRTRTVHPDPAEREKGSVLGNYRF